MAFTLVTLAFKGRIRAYIWENLNLELLVFSTNLRKFSWFLLVQHFCTRQYSVSLKYPKIFYDLIKFPYNLQVLQFKTIRQNSHFPLEQLFQTPLW